MVVHHHEPDRWNDIVAGLTVIIMSATVAILGGRSFCGSWNDGSRLATVECLVDFRTLAIDRSIFAQVPRESDATGGAPYPSDQVALLQHGTLDKLFINGHFYSDKSPVPGLLMAVLYKGLQMSTGLTARKAPGPFCYGMTVATSGVAYVLAVWCVFRFGRQLQLTPPWSLCLSASFALASVALPYTRNVNNHILLLAVASAILCCLNELATRAYSEPRRSLCVLGLGTLAGVGYTIDLGTGPLLLVGTLATMAYRLRSLAAVATFVLTVLPWLGLHHAVNYGIGGSLRPANAIPEHFQWPGSPFDAANLTGVFSHPSFGHALIYAAETLVGKRGFLGHNLPLLLAVVCCPLLLRRRIAEWPQIAFAGFWCSCTWLAYAFASNNYSGACCSVRWFVPLLAPGYYVLALLLREYPRYRRDFLILSAWGALLAALMWWKGPWMTRMVPFYWPIQAAAIISWVLVRAQQRSSVTVNVNDSKATDLTGAVSTFRLRR